MARKPYDDLRIALSKAIKDFIHKYKRKPSEKEFANLRDRLMKDLNQKMRLATSRNFKEVYSRGMREVERNLRTTVTFNHIDQNALFLLNNNPALKRSFENLSLSLGSKINDILIEEYGDPKGLNLRRLNQKIQDTLNVGTKKANLIARMETSKVSNAARNISYRKDPRFDSFKFKWIGPNDNRTTEQSKEIKRLVGDGVSWEELVAIVTQTAKKYFPTFNVDPNTLVDHWNTRHTFVRVVNPKPSTVLNQIRANERITGQVF